MYSLPAQKGLERHSFQIFEIITDGLPTYHAYSIDGLSRDGWRFSTAIQEIDSTTVLDDIPSTYFWVTRSGSTYSCKTYKDFKFESLEAFLFWFKGDSIRALNEEEFKEWLVNFR
jgi:hypothetical protein